MTEVAQAGEVLFRLDNVVLKKFFVGQFRKAEEAPHEKRMIAHFDADSHRGHLGTWREERAAPRPSRLASKPAA